MTAPTSATAVRTNGAAAAALLRAHRFRAIELLPWADRNRGLFPVPRLPPAGDPDTGADPVRDLARPDRRIRRDRLARPRRLLRHRGLHRRAPRRRRLAGADLRARTGCGHRRPAGLGLGLDHPAHAGTYAADADHGARDHPLRAGQGPGRHYRRLRRHQFREQRHPRPVPVRRALLHDELLVRLRLPGARLPGRPHRRPRAVRPLAGRHPRECPPHARNRHAGATAHAPCLRHRGDDCRGGGRDLGPGPGQHHDRRLRSSRCRATS